MARSREGMACLGAAGLLVALLAPAGAEAGEQPVLTLVTDTDSTRAYRIVSRVYLEAFRRLGLRVRFEVASLNRRTALAVQGSADGEFARIRAYAETHPELVRVDEPILEFAFALFTARPEIQLARVEELAGRPWTVEYRRGIMLCESTLRRVVPAERLSDITTTEQGVRKLAAGRSDLYCDLEDYVPEALRTPALRDVSGVRRVLRITSLPTYPYLHGRHAALAPRLAGVLRQIKAEGLYAVYEREADAAVAPAQPAPSAK